DARSLAQAVIALMDDEPLAARLGAAARAHVDGRYSFDRMVASIEQIYLTQLRRCDSRRFGADVRSRLCSGFLSSDAGKRQPITSARFARPDARPSSPSATPNR